MTNNSEKEQSLIRITIVSALMITLIFVTKSFLSNAVLLCAAYLIFSGLLHASIKFHPKSNIPRQWMCLVLDITLTSAEYVIAGEYGVLLLGIYLWLIIGYGLRYGTKFLKGAAALSLVGFIAAFQHNSFYSSHSILMYGLLLMLILIPIHALRLLNQLIAAREKAEYASKAKSQFLSHISHEIRTPLNGVIGGAQLLLNTKLSVDQKIYTHTINNSSKLLMQLVNNVLDLAKIESGKMPVSMVKFNLIELIEDVIATLRPLVDQKNIALDFKIDDGVYTTLMGDRLHLQQVLLNLVGNAVKFTNQGYVKIKITPLMESEMEACLRFEIADTGIGIAENAVTKIFESFTQADDNIKFTYGGTGLGTTISKQLIALMGGKIGVESHLGRGSTFWFELFFIKTENDIATVNYTDSTENIVYDSDTIVSLSARTKLNSKRQVNVLVADDSDINLTIVSKILTNADFKVYTAKNGELALDVLENTSIDIMIIDNNMPVLNGLEMLKIHQVINLNRPRIPTAILSADATYETIGQYKDIGVDAYLTKPVDMNQLIQTVNTLAEQSFKNQAALVTAEKTADVLAYKPRKKNTPPVKYFNQVRLNNLSLLANTDYTFIQSLVTDFVKDTELKLNELKVLSSLKDLRQLSSVGHTIAGIASEVGADELEILGRKLESVMPTDDLVLITKLIKQIEYAFTITKHELEKYLAEKNIPFSH